MSIYYILGSIVYGIFLVQFLGSVFFGDTDIDLDFDADADFEVSDMLSFKGLIHFLMGLFGWLMLAKHTHTVITALDWATGCGIGLIFMATLALLYRLVLKLQSENLPENSEGSKLVGSRVVIYLVHPNNRYTVTVERVGDTIEVPALSKSGISYSKGEITAIVEYDSQGNYLIP